MPLRDLLCCFGGNERTVNVQPTPAHVRHSLGELQQFLYGIQGGQAERLLEEYRKVYDPGYGKDMGSQTGPMSNICSCSGAAYFVVSYITGDRSVCGKMEATPHQRIISPKDKDGTQKILSTIKTHAPTGGVGMLWGEADDAHYVSFAGQGDHWGFYQANYSGKKDSFTLAYYLNQSLSCVPEKPKDWNKPSLTLAEMLGLLESLTDSKKSREIYPFAKSGPIIQWNIRFYSFDGIDRLAW